MPGVIVGAIFVTVMVLGEFATASALSGRKVNLLGNIIITQVGSLKWAFAAVAGVVLTVVMAAFVAVMLRIVNLRNQLVGDIDMDKVVSLRWFLGIFTAAFILFLYGPFIVMGILSFQQGPEGGPQFPIIEWSTYWYQHVFGLTPPSRVAPLPLVRH